MNRQVAEKCTWANQADKEARMRRSVILIAMVSVFLMACACVAGIYLLRNALPLPLRTETAKASDGSEIVLPAGYKILDVKDQDALSQEAEKMREPARSLLASSVDRAVFAAAQGEDRLLLVTASDAILFEIPESDLETWRADQEEAYREVFERIAEGIRSDAPGSDVSLEKMEWSDREGTPGVLRMQLSYAEKGRRQDVWIGVVHFPRRIYTVIGVGDEDEFRTVLDRSRFAPERGKGAAKASPTPTRRARTPAPTRRATPTPSPVAEESSVKASFAFPPGWRALSREEIRRMDLSGVPPEARAFVEAGRDSAEAVAYERGGEGIIVVVRQKGGATPEQVEMIRQGWESLAPTLADGMRSIMEKAGWTDVEVDEPELFDHQPGRGEAALLAVRMHGRGTFSGIQYDFWSAILYYEDVVWIVTANNADWETLRYVVENSEWR
jgi:hypothetical protein